MENTGKFILHCMVCSLGGSHIGYHTQIAAIDPDKLKLPLDSSMFSSYWPERGLPAPWQPGLNWLEMKCPRCGRLPWTFMPDDTERLMKQGGPDLIRTSNGMVRLLPDGWHGESEGEVVEELTEAPVINACSKCRVPFEASEDDDYSVCPVCGDVLTKNGEVKSPLQCPYCDFVGKNARSRATHIRLKHKGE